VSLALHHAFRDSLDNGSHRQRLAPIDKSNNDSEELKPPSDISTTQLMSVLLIREAARLLRHDMEVDLAEEGFTMCVP
jgi:hypothetical protein